MHQNEYLWSKGLEIFADDKISPLSKLKAFADDDFIVPQMVKFFYDRVENTMGKGD